MRDWSFRILKNQQRILMYQQAFFVLVSVFRYCCRLVLVFRLFSYFVFLLFLAFLSRIHVSLECTRSCRRKVYRPYSEILIEDLATLGARETQLMVKHPLLTASRCDMGLFSYLSSSSSSESDSSLVES